MRGTKKPQEAESTQLAAENTDAEFPWMVKGTVSQKSSGSCNVLVVVPHSDPKTDLNTEQLGAYLAIALDSYAIINNHKYRAPDTRKKEKPNQSANIIDLNLLDDAGECQEDYVAPLLDLIEEISKTSQNKTLLFFIGGTGDPIPDARDSRLVLTDFTSYRSPVNFPGNEKLVSDSQEFLRDLIDSLKKQKFRVLRDRLERSDEPCKLGAHLVLNRIGMKLAMEAFELQFRFKGYRDTVKNTRKTAERLAKAIGGLSSFKSWRDEVMVRKSDVESKNRVELKAEEETVGRTQNQLEPGGGTVAYEEPPQPSSPDTLPGYGSKVQVISPEKFQTKIDTLRASTTIKNDDGEEVPFEGEAKEEFIRLYQEGYPIIERAMKSVYETGHFLFEVRRVLKPKKLFLTWMSSAGLRERNSYRSLKAYERYGDHLLDFAHLGIRKLLAAAQLKNCVEYLEEHAEDAEKQTVEQFEEMVRKLKANKPKTGKGRRPSYEEIAGYKVRRTGDGTKITIEGLSKKSQEKLFEAIKKLLLKDKDRT